MAIEFNTQDEMFQFLSDGSDLGEKFETIRSSSVRDKSSSYLVWIKVWQIPLGAWNINILSLIAGKLGELVILD